MPQSKSALIQKAKSLGVKRYTKMSVEELQAAIIDAERQEAEEAASPDATFGHVPESVTERLHAIQRQVPVVEKTGEVAFKGVSYEHMQEHGLLGLLRPYLTHFKLGIISDTMELEAEGNMVRMKIAYTIYCADQPRDDSNPNWSVTTRMWTQGVDQSDKAINKAYTNGMKYFLQKAFLVPTDQVDDVEGSDEAHNLRSTASTAKAAGATLAGLRARAQQLVSDQKLTNNDVVAYLTATFGTSQVMDLTGAQAVDFGKFLDSKE